MTTLTKCICRCKVATLLLAAVALLPEPSSAQLRLDVALVEPTRVLTLDRCAVGPADYAPQWSVLFDAAALSSDSARVELRQLEDALRDLTLERPDDAELRYVLAATVGMRAELEGGLAQVETAKEALMLAQSVLDVDPDHAGASHLVGRLHHEVLRMSRVKRFLATRVLGASDLAGASWDEARRLLEAGVVGDPCRPDHHYDLARLYADRDQTAMARERLVHVLEMRVRTPRDLLVIERATALLARLDSGG